MRLLAGISLAALALGLAGCGGGSSSTTTTTAAATTAAGAGQRLTAAQWQTYQAAYEPFHSANQAALKKINTCGKSARSNAQAKACLGGPLATVRTTTTKLQGVLGGFNGKVAGACASATNDYAGYLTLYASTVAQLQSSLDKAATTAVNTALKNLQTFIPQGRAKVSAFDTACKPA